jgi:hypothetical protein
MRRSKARTLGRRTGPLERSVHRLAEADVFVKPCFVGSALSMLFDRNVAPTGRERNRADR